MDVAIIGAGPAGAITAHRLASKGIKVALIDQAVFPRPKTCGDLVTQAGLDCLARTGLEKWASPFAPIRSLRFSSPENIKVDVDLPGVSGTGVGKILPRLELDYQLVQAAVYAGAKLMDGCRVDGVDLGDENKVYIRTATGGIDANFLILADGSRAPVTRKLGLIKGDFDLWAVQQYLEGDPEPGGPIEFHFQANVLPGYTWLIPMGDGKVNIGAGTYTRRVRNREIDLVKILEQFKKKHPISKNRLHGCHDLSSIRAHPLRTQLNRTRTHAARLLVAGDAAGLVSPFTGEGIASAMVSGEMAARYALLAFEEGDFSAAYLASYSRELLDCYEKDKMIARVLRSILKYPLLLNHIMKRMNKVCELAYLFGQVFMDEKPAWELVKLGTFNKLLFS
jgi:menaquinone-9 beta-reductase